MYEILKINKILYYREPMTIVFTQKLKECISLFFFLFLLLPWPVFVYWVVWLGQKVFETTDLKDVNFILFQSSWMLLLTWVRTCESNIPGLYYLIFWKNALTELWFNFMPSAFIKGHFWRIVIHPFGELFCIFCKSLLEGFECHIIWSVSDEHSHDKVPL